MTIYGISDFHLSGNNFGFKPMTDFGWPGDYLSQISQDCKSKVKDDDYILCPGDLSWSSLHEDSSEEDMQWIKSLPGIKILSKGNHDKGWGLMMKHKDEKTIFVNSYYEDNNIVVFTHIGEDLPYVKYSKEKTTKDYMKWHSFLTHVCNQIDAYAFSPKYELNKGKLHIEMCHIPPIAHSFEYERKIFDWFDLIVSGHLHTEESRQYLYNEDNKYFNVTCDLNHFKLTKLCEA